MSLETNNGLTFTEETLICIRRDGELIAVEKVNGKIERWSTKHVNLTESRKIYGLDKVQV